MKMFICAVASLLVTATPTLAASNDPVSTRAIVEKSAPYLLNSTALASEVRRLTELLSETERARISERLAEVLVEDNTTGLTCFLPQRLAGLDIDKVSGKATLTLCARHLILAGYSQATQALIGLIRLDAERRIGFQVAIVQGAEASVRDFDEFEKNPGMAYGLGCTPGLRAYLLTANKPFATCFSINSTAAIRSEMWPKIRDQVIASGAPVSDFDNNFQYWSIQDQLTANSLYRVFSFAVLHEFGHILNEDFSRPPDVNIEWRADEFATNKMAQSSSLFGAIAMHMNLTLGIHMALIRKATRERFSSTEVDARYDRWMPAYDCAIARLSRLEGLGESERQLLAAAIPSSIVPPVKPDGCR